MYNHICKVCKKSFESKYSNRLYCSNKCRSHQYYINHQEELNNRRKINYKKNYIPKKRNILSKEEKQLKQHEKYLANKSYYQEKNRQWYQQHKNDTDLKQRHSIAMHKYYLKKKNIVP